MQVEDRFSTPGVQPSANVDTSVETPQSPIIEARALTKYFPLQSGLFGLGKREVVKAVDGVTLSAYTAETLAIVGESGCGKTTLGRMLAGLITPSSGKIYFRGEGLESRRDKAARKAIQIVFQDPYSSLNPRKTIREILDRPLTIHGLATQDREKRIRELLKLVRLELDSLDRYPHEFSGGQLQRIAIARALATEPEVIIADEPVSALDVSVQAQIIDLLAELREQMKLTLILITHNLALVKYIADSVAVMYLGKMVEYGPVNSVFQQPLHPYTAALLKATGVPDPGQRGRRRPLEGEIPSPIHPPSGCAFHTRCPIVQPKICASEEPILREITGIEAAVQAHFAACHFAEREVERPT